MAVKQAADGEQFECRQCGAVVKLNIRVEPDDVLCGDCSAEKLGLENGLLR